MNIFHSLSEYLEQGRNYSLFGGYATLPNPCNTAKFLNLNQITNVPLCVLYNNIQMSFPYNTKATYSDFYIFLLFGRYHWSRCDLSTDNNRKTLPQNEQITGEKKVNPLSSSACSVPAACAVKWQKFL